MELEHLGKRMQQARQSAGLSQTEMGKLIHRTQGTVSQWERQVRVPVGLELIDDYCRITGHSLEFIVGADTTFVTVHRQSDAGKLVVLIEEYPQEFNHLARYAAFLLEEQFRG